VPWNPAGKGVSPIPRGASRGRGPWVDILVQDTELADRTWKCVAGLWSPQVPWGDWATPFPGPSQAPCGLGNSHLV